MEKEEFRKRLFFVISHVDRVRQNGEILINKLIDEGDQNLALRLAEAISIHDNGKFSFIEFHGMYSENSEIKKIAITHHRTSNRHHLSYHVSYREMGNCDIAEMVVDLKSRSDEFGDNLREFFQKFLKEHKISSGSNFAKKANYFINLILNHPFKQIKDIEIKV